MNQNSTRIANKHQIDAVMLINKVIQNQSNGSWDPKNSASIQ